jgi:hypothetical protein
MVLPRYKHWLTFNIVFDMTCFMICSKIYVKNIYFIMTYFIIRYTLNMTYLFYIFIF